MIEILFYILIIFVTLLVLYIIAKIFPEVGEIIANALATMVRWLVWMEIWITDRRKECHSIYKALVREIEKSVTGNAAPRTGQASVTGAIIARIFWFIVVAGLITGEAYNILAAVPALFKVAYPNLGDYFVIASASLFICPALAFGGIFLETVGITLAHDPLFPNLENKSKKWQRILLAILSLIGLVMTLAVIYEFFQYRALYLDPTLRAQTSTLEIANLTLNIFDLLAISVFLAIALLWHAFVRGIEVLFLLMMGLLSLSLLVLAFVISLIPLSVEQITLALSNRKITPYHSLQRQTPTNQSSQSDILQVSVIFGGAFGSEAFNGFTKRFMQSFVLTYALLDLDNDQSLISTQRINAKKNIAPDRGEREQHSQKPSGDIYKELFKIIGNNQTEAHGHFPTGILLYILDCHTLGDAEDMLRKVHQDLPNHSLVVLTSVSARDLQDNKVKNNLDLLKQLKDDSVLTRSILIDPASPFAKDKGHGQDVQLEFVAHSVMGLLSAYRYREDGWQNPTMAQALAKLPADNSPYLGLSLASEKLEGNIKFGDVLEKAKNLTQTVIETKADTRAYESDIPTNQPLILLCHMDSDNFQRDYDFTQFCLNYRSHFATGANDFSVMVTPEKGMWYIEKRELEPKLSFQVTCFYPFDTY